MRVQVTTVALPDVLAAYTVKERPEYVREVVSRLPQRNYTVLRHIVRFLSEVAAQSTENK